MIFTVHEEEIFSGSSLGRLRGKGAEEEKQTFSCCGYPVFWRQRWGAARSGLAGGGKELGQRKGGGFGTGGSAWRVAGAPSHGSPSRRAKMRAGKATLQKQRGQLGRALHGGAKSPLAKELGFSGSVQEFIINTSAEEVLFCG